MDLTVIEQDRRLRRQGYSSPNIFLDHDDQSVIVLWEYEPTDPAEMSIEQRIYNPPEITPFRSDVWFLESLGDAIKLLRQIAIDRSVSPTVEWDRHVRNYTFWLTNP